MIHAVLAAKIVVELFPSLSALGLVIKSACIEKVLAQLSALPLILGREIIVSPSACYFNL